MAESEVLSATLHERFSLKYNSRRAYPENKFDQSIIVVVVISGKTQVRNELRARIFK